MNIDLEQIKNLLDVVSATDITELSIESGEEKITIKKQTQTVVAASTLELPAHFQAAPKTQSPQVYPLQSYAPEADSPSPAQGSSKSGNEEESNSWISITSPMVGTFYRASGPNAPPFVDIGDMVSPGQTVCIIEAMKLMNDLPAEVSGRIVKCCVENGSTVEYGQTLFMVNPRG